MKSILDFLAAIYDPLTRPPSADDLSPAAGGEVTKVVSDDVGYDEAIRRSFPPTPRCGRYLLAWVTTI